MPTALDTDFCRGIPGGWVRVVFTCMGQSLSVLKRKVIIKEMKISIWQGILQQDRGGSARLCCNAIRALQVSGDNGSFLEKQ